MPLEPEPQAAKFGGKLSSSVLRKRKIKPPGLKTFPYQKLINISGPRRLVIAFTCDEYDEVHKEYDILQHIPATIAHLGVQMLDDQAASSKFSPSS